MVGHDSPPATALPHVKQHHPISFPINSKDVAASTDGRAALMNTNRQISHSATNLSLSPTMTTNTVSTSHINFILNDNGSQMARSASLKEVISSPLPNSNIISTSINLNAGATTSSNNISAHSNTANSGSVGLSPSIPFVRSRTGPQQQSHQSQFSQPTQPQQQQQQQLLHMQQQQPQFQPHCERRDSHSVVSQASTGAGDAWQWQENNDPDDQEQALFEQRLCEDIYGVAVRKINHNGKSNLRYVKCSFYDASELEHNGASGHLSHSLQNSSSRSLSSRSRNGFSRFLGGDRSVDRIPNSNSALDPLRNSITHNLVAVVDGYDAHRNLIPGKKIKALTWGKKKDVKIPIDRFVMVRKGKTTDRTKRNVCPASRILSLITDDSVHMSLDIEAPTRLDRDKFARAFSRFLNVPLEPENDIRSVRSDMTPQSTKDQRQPSASQPVSHGFMHDSTANSSVPDIAMTTTNSYTTNASSRKHAPLPVVTTGSGSDVGVAGSGSSQLPSKPAAAATRSFKWREGGGISGISHDINAISIDRTSSNINHPFDVPDPQVSSLPSSSNNDTTLAFPPNGAGTGGSNTNGNSSFNGGLELGNSKEQKMPEMPPQQAAIDTPVNGAGTSVHVHTPGGDDAVSVVSSITGAGFDQDLVEELHLALEKMRRELDESRAEASRAVKVAEQAIQSAENSSSKDWNSTVTHKAAEAAAVAQKKSAEAMAKARMAEERLETEKKNALMWKKQVETAEEQAGHWQTRAAAAEVQRHAVAEALESERKKNSQLIALTSKNGKSSGTDGGKENVFQADAFDPFDSFRDLPALPADATDAAEIDRLRSKLAMESARRRKLLDELQDLRGSVRVYCRPRAPSNPASSTITMASNEVLMLQRDGSSSSPPSGMSSVTSSGFLPPLSFQFDGILSSEMDQHDVYAEFEAICASVVEGYKVCIMTYGQSSAGKSYTMFGEVECRKNQTVAIVDHGIHFRSMQQLFSILEHRRDRYKDVVTMTLIEVHEERLIDLLARTEYGEAHGRVEGTRKSSSRRSDGVEDSNANASQQANSITSKSKLEIKTSRDGETVVHGVLSVDVSSFADVYRLWTESLAGRSKRLAEQDVDPRLYELGSHVIATLKVNSRNLASGLSTSGRIQFVDFASSDIVVKRSSRKSASNASASNPDPVNGDDWKFVNKSLNTVSDVVRARSQYQRSVPYRNSTVTHLISDSLEADTKVVMIACVSPDEKDVQNTACTLRFAQELRKVVVGKATRHTTTTTTSMANPPTPA